MRARIIGRLNRVFDHKPGATLALRIRSPGGLTWTVKDRVLVVSRPGAVDLKVNLEGNTLLVVRDTLAAAGVEIAYQAGPDILTLGGVALIQGHGDQDESNGDWLRIYTSLLWAWAEPVGRWLDTAKADIPKALRELVVPQSTGQWSDLWASYFGLGRGPGETDEHLNFRTAYDWRRPKSNPLAIELNIKTLLGANVTVREPWMEMFTLSGGSELSGADHFPDAVEFCYHTAQLTSPDFQVWPPISAQADSDRPAGTIFLPPVTIPLPVLVSNLSSNRSVAFSVTEHASWDLVDYDGEILSYNAGLSDTYVELAPQMSVGQAISLRTYGSPDPPAASFVPITYAVGEIALSDGPEMGDLQGHFPGTMLVEVGDPLSLSDVGGLSDYADALVWQPIDVWIDQAQASGVPALPGIEPLGAFVGEGVAAATGPSGSLGVVETANSVSAIALGPYGYGPTGYAVTLAILYQPVSASSAASSSGAGVLSTGIPLAATSRAIATSALRAPGPPGYALTHLASTGLPQFRYAPVLVTGIRLAGAAGAQASGSEALSTGISLAADGGGVASGSASLSTGSLFIGGGAAQAAGSGTISTVSFIAGGSSSTASGAGALTTGTLLASTSAAAAGCSASLSTGIHMVGAGSALASGSEVLWTGIPLAAGASASAGGTASLSTGIPLAGSGGAQASGSEALSTSISLIATASATAGGAAGLSTGISMASATSGIAAGAGSLSTGILLGGGAAAAASGAAALSTGILMVAAGNGVAAGGAVLSTGIPLAAGSAAAAAGSGDVSTQIVLVAGASASAAASGRIAVTGYAMTRAAAFGLVRFR